MNSLAEMFVRALFMFALGSLIGTSCVMVVHYVRTVRRWKKLQKTFDDLDADMKEFDKRNMT